jgi:hypothetical protein
MVALCTADAPRVATLIASGGRDRMQKMAQAVSALPGETCSSADLVAVLPPLRGRGKGASRNSGKTGSGLGSVGIFRIRRLCDFGALGAPVSLITSSTPK